MSKLCTLLGHQANWKVTFAQDGHWVGVCKRCGIPLTRAVNETHWTPATEFRRLESGHSSSISGL
jgi:hypothetical protein